MSTPLEDYALLSDMHTGALVSREGSIDWLCLPRFDSPAFFSALLGDETDGRWQLAVVDGEVTSRRYVGHSKVLETIWKGPSGEARVLDFLPPDDDNADLIRHVECLSGEVEIANSVHVRFDYGRATAWTRRHENADDGRARLLSLAGPDAVLFTGEGLDDWHCDGLGRVDSDGAFLPTLVGVARMSAGEVRDWQLTWFNSWETPPHPAEPAAALKRTYEYWEEWAARFDASTRANEPVLRSLLTLRALTHHDTGGIVAAPTTSLPEWFGGERNWDYRYTWLRDAALTIEALIAHGATSGATAWRDWLLRAVAGDMNNLRIMYGLGGERDLDEKELPHLRGYEDSRPVRIGNGAAEQFQADVPGEVMIALSRLRDAGVEEDQWAWQLQRGLLDYCESRLHDKDHGIWEMRGDEYFFTHGRVMMWAAFNEGVKAVENYGYPGDVDKWRRIRQELEEEIEQHGFNAELNSYVQTYGDTDVDASLLQIPHTGYLTADDPRMLGTVARIEATLVDEHGLVHRYPTDGKDGLDGDEYPFFLCCFWLVRQYADSGRMEDARALYEQLLSYGGEMGLLAEEYDPESGRQAGNYPQAFSHLGLIDAADAIEGRSRISDDETGENA